MSEEDKLKKRKKIESNRAKKNGTVTPQPPITPDGQPPAKVKREDDAAVNETDGDPFLFKETSQDSKLFFQNGEGAEKTNARPTAIETSKLLDSSFVWPSQDSSPSEIVNSIIDSPVGSTRIINHLMNTPQEAIIIMEKIINSPKDAIQIISHFINSPGDALKIISKIMNSPFDALTIFTKFMSSPTDALEVITKILRSPNDVLQFLQSLMRNPEDGLDIMNKFMNAPAEALRMINSMMNQMTGGRVDSTTTEEGAGVTDLIDIQPSDSIMENSAQLKVILDRMGEHLSGGSPTSYMPSSSTVDADWDNTQREEKSESGTNEKSETFDRNAKASVIENSVNGGEMNQSLSALFGTIPGSGASGPTTTKDIIDMLISQQVNSMDSVILSEAIKLEYECVMPTNSGMPNASPSSMYMGTGGGGGGGMGDVRALNEVEQAKLNELILAHQALYAPVNEDISSLIADDYRLKVS